MQRISKEDTKTTVDRILDRAHVVRQNMADALSWTKSYLSRVLSPNDELDGFVYGFLRVMAYLAEEYPKAFNEIDSLVRRLLDGMRQPQSEATIPRDATGYAMALNHVAERTVNAMMDERKTAHDVRERLVVLAGLVAEIQRSYDGAQTRRATNASEFAERR